jgi:hypothetical protein
MLTYTHAFAALALILALFGSGGFPELTVAVISLGLALVCSLIGIFVSIKFFRHTSLVVVFPGLFVFASGNTLLRLLLTSHGFRLDEIFLLVGILFHLIGAAVVMVGIAKLTPRLTVTKSYILLPFFVFSLIAVGAPFAEIFGDHSIRKTVKIISMTITYLNIACIIFGGLYAVKREQFVDQVGGADDNVWDDQKPQPGGSV